MDNFKIQEQKPWRYRPLLLIIIILVGLFYIWASTSQITQHVRAQGRIIPSGQAQVVQHLEGGIVSEISIREGETVERGQIIMQVTNQQASSNLEEQRIAMQALRLKLDRLNDEYDGKSEFTPDQQAPPEMADMVENEKRLFKSRTQAFAEKINILNDQIRQKTLRLEDLSAQFVNLQAEREIARNQLAISERLRRSGAISESKYLDSQSRVKNFDTRLAQIQKTIPVTKAEITEIRNQISQETERKNIDVIGEMNEVELDLQQLQERIKARIDEVDRTAIISPTKGIVNKIYVNTIGGVVRSGQPLVEIIPVEDNLIAEARVLTKDRGLIWNGLPATVKITAYDYAIYGGIEGVVKEISADTLVDDQGARFYRVRVGLKDNKIEEDKPLFPGMSVEINIISGEKSVLHSLLKPLWRIRENALREP